MEVKSAKVLDNGQTIVVDLKRKRAARCAGHFSGAARMVARRYAIDLPSKKLHKRVRSGGCKNRCGSHFNKSLLKNYSNFMKSGLPHRLMFYHNGDWTDFPEGFIVLAKEDFQVKKAAVEVEFEGQRSVLDFLHMVQIDLNTGVQRPIAWIDEGGSCFFPEMYSDADELHECFQAGDEKDNKLLCSEPNGTREIKLQLEIELTAADSSKSLECIEESNTRVKRLKVEGKPATNRYEMEQDDSSGEKPDVDIKEATGENKLLDAISHSQNPILESLHGKLSPDSVQHMFLTGMHSPFCAKNILEVQRGSSMSAQARLELFQKQVEITKKYRGSANVRYAWLASSKEAVCRILMHGLGVDGLPKTRPRYGLGVHLTPADCPSISASYCDVDENGVQYMFLCRIIMGNMELVHPGSEQFHPSSENFDSGVDDLQNPKQYVIWNVNMNTHIFPEYVVSFRAPLNEKGCPVSKQSRIDVSGVTNSAFSQRKFQQSNPFDSVEDSHPWGLNPTVGSASPKVPKSPCMPFPLLFAAIKDKVPPKAMDSVNFQYDLFRRKMINRYELVQRLRCIIGDTLLRSTIISLPRSKLPATTTTTTTATGCVTVVPKQEQET